MLSKLPTTRLCNKKISISPKCLIEFSVFVINQDFHQFTTLQFIAFLKQNKRKYLVVDKNNSLEWIALLSENLLFCFHQNHFSFMAFSPYTQFPFINSTLTRLRCWLRARKGGKNHIQWKYGFYQLEIISKDDESLSTWLEGGDEISAFFPC